MIQASRFSARGALLAAISLLTWAGLCAAGDLPNRSDTTLQSALEATVGELGLAGDAKSGHLAVALVDVTEQERPRVAMINGHEMFYAASLPKIAILLGAAVQLDAGRLEMDPALEHDLNDMIRVSCNACATRVLDRVGREDLLAILQSPEYRFYDRQNGGGLWVGKPYGPEAAYHRDPLDNQSHGATVYQAARFYYQLYQRDLVSAEQSAMMLETLARPGLEHKFVKGLSEFEDLEIYRKSGSWQHYHADSALVVAPNHAYIMVALVEDGKGSRWLEEMAPRLHRLVVSPAPAP